MSSLFATRSFIRNISYSVEYLTREELRRFDVDPRDARAPCLICMEEEGNNREHYSTHPMLDQYKARELLAKHLQLKLGHNWIPIGRLSSPE